MDRHKFCTKFCDRLLQVTSITSAVFKDKDLESLRNKLLIARNQLPEEVIKMGGPMLWRHREAICARNEEKLLELQANECATESDAAKIKKEGYDIVDLIAKAKDMWSRLSSENKSEIFECLREAISCVANVVKIDNAAAK
jgi:hypothetical protein